MSTRQSISRTLHTLLPSYSATLPDALVDLAISLYAHSRTKASALRPEEEVARECVCCVLAAERLKQRLNLPPIEPRPPCPPRVYKKLYNYLHAALSAPSNPAGRPERRTDALTARFDRPPQPESQPSTHAAVELKRKQVADLTQKDAGLQTWIAPAINHISRSIGHPELTPHIYVGFSSIVKAAIEASSEESRKRAKIEGTSLRMKKPFAEDEYPGLLLAITVLALERATQEGRQFNDEKAAKAIAQEMVALKRVSITKVGVCLSMAAEYLEDFAEQWKQMDWYVSTPQPSKRPTAQEPEIDSMPLPGEEATVDEECGSSNALDEPLHDPLESRLQSQTPKKTDPQQTLPHAAAQPKRTRIAGATVATMGTMMQDRTDWLNEQNRADYVRWKDNMMKRVSQLEKPKRRMPVR